MLKSKRIAAIAVITMGLVPPMGIQATDSVPSDTIGTNELKEVVVESYIAKPLQEYNVGMLSLDIPLKYLPVTVSRLDHKTIERKHITSMEEAVRFMPGVVLSNNQLGAFQRYSLRGTTDVVFAFDGFRDERTLTNNVPFGDLSNVEAIEIIKGPASILAGHSVMGGVINIIRKKPKDKFSGRGSISYGSWNQKDASFGMGGKIYGPVHYWANVFFSNGDGYRKVNSNRFSGMFALNSQIGKNGFWEAQVNFADDKYMTDIGGAPTMPADIFYTSTDKLYLSSGSRNPLCDYEKVYNDLGNNRMRRRLLDVSTTYTHTFTSWLKFRERFSYNHSNLDYCCVEGLSYVTSTNPDGYKYYYKNPRNGKIYYTNLDSLISGTPLNFNPDHKTISNVAELAGKFGTGQIEHNYVGGWITSFFNFTQYNGYNNDDVWGPGVGEIVSVSDPHEIRDWWDCKVSAAVISHYTTNGIYLTDVFDINRHWKGMLSGRLDIYRYKRATAKIEDGKQHYNKADRTAWNKVNTSAFTYRAGIVYLPIPEVSLYGSMASFFKPYNTFYNKNYIYYDRNGKEFFPDENNGEVYKPQTGYQSEVGARYEHKLFDINASVYLIKKRNVVTNVGKMPVEENGEQIEKTVQAQVGQYDSRGFDFDVTIHPWSTLQIVAGLGWSDYRQRASEMDWAKGLPWITLDENGKINLRATGVPRTTFYTYMDYTVPNGVLQGLSIHLSGTYTDKIYQNLTNNVYDPARYVVDGGLYYSINSNCTIAVLVNNIFNNHYFASATRLAKPRNFMATVSYNF